MSKFELKGEAASRTPVYLACAGKRKWSSATVSVRVLIQLCVSVSISVAAYLCVHVDT